MSRFRILIFLCFFFLSLSGLSAATFGVFFVPGAYSDVDPKQKGKTFEYQKALLDSTGIPWREVKILSTRPYLESVPLLQSELSDLTWDSYFIVSFSMGGIITEHTLTEYPQLQERLAGWIAFQSPFYGSPMVDRAARLLDRTARLRRFFDPSACALANALSQSEREQYMQSRKEKIERLTAHRPVVCIASDSDEVVDPRSATLPGAEVIRVTGARHLDLTIGQLASQFQPILTNGFHEIGLHQFSNGLCSHAMKLLGLATATAP